jgi:hypothetical protein
MKYEFASFLIVCVLLFSVVGCSDEVPVQKDSSPNSRDETNSAEDVDSAPSPDSEAQPVEKTPLEIFPVEGIVTYKGKPVVGIMLTFDPISKGRPSYGMTDNNGRFIMSYSITTDGVEAGKHDVTFDFFDDNVVDSPELTPAIKAILNAHGENRVPLPIEITRETKDLRIELPLE